MSGVVPGGEARGWHEPRRGTRGPTRAHSRLTVRHPCEPQNDEQEDQADLDQCDSWSEPGPDRAPDDLAGPNLTVRNTE
ncbi:hypothetical protein GCM10009664_34960 [Kitasatospora gansuensis]